jgi:hypothetical protein
MTGVMEVQRNVVRVGFAPVGLLDRPVELLDRVAGFARKPEYALTRRDIAHWIVTTPGASALLPELRRELMAIGEPLSAAFWESAEQLLERIETGEATVGQVRKWLEASGSEPTQIIGLHVWDDEGERRPLADRLHAQLVDHLERQVLQGAIDPDRLLAHHPEAHRAYVAEQVRWLHERMPDGCTRMEALEDEQDEEFLADWDAADAEALATLDEVLADVGERPCPAAELHAACDRLRAGLRDGAPPYDLLATCGGVDAEALPSDDVELWLVHAAGVPAPRAAPPEHYAVELVSASYALDHADWLCVVAELARRGPGAPAEDTDLAGYVDSSDVVDGELEPGDVDAIASGFLGVVELWRALGAVDEDGRLTALGWWGLPEAQRLVWAAEDP